MSVSATAGTVTVRPNGQSDLTRLERAVTGLCHGIAPADRPAGPRHHSNPKHDHSGHDHGRELHGHDHGPKTGPWWQSRKAELPAASGIALIVAYGVGKLVPVIASWLFIVAMLAGLVPIARRAFVAARTSTPFSIEMLMRIVAVGAVVIVPRLLFGAAWRDGFTGAWPSC